ncbi:hypothetical protein [Microcoleus sp. herbarium12]
MADSFCTWMKGWLAFATIPPSTNHQLLDSLRSMVDEQNSLT